MVQGMIKKFISISLFSFFCIVLTQSNALGQISPPINTSFGCASNAVAPLDSIKDLQTYLNCNGFNPGPIDGVSGGRTTSAIKAFQSASGLVPDGVVGPATKQAMRSYSEESFTFTGSGWGHGVGLSQYGAKGLTELGASFCSNTSSCTSNEVVDYYFADTKVKNLSEISLSSPEIATESNALWVGLARNARSINLTTLPSSSPPMLSI